MAGPALDDDLRAGIEDLARKAARADVAAGGGIETGLLVASLLARAATARQEGWTKERFYASLSAEERRWLNL